MGKDILKVERLERVFRVGSEDVHALRGVSFTIQEGEFVSIMGTSGSGKSTLLNILGCLDTPTAGDYIIDGVSIRNLSKNEFYLNNTIYEIRNIKKAGTNKYNPA